MSKIVVRCAIYPRKSKQNDKSESMEVQTQMCEDYIKQNYENYTIKLYDKDYGVTGHSIKARKDFQRMMQDIKSGEIDIVVIQRYDRIARNTRDFCNLYHDMEKSGCNLVSVSQMIDTSTPYGKKFMYDLASTAELEWALNSERHKDVNKYARMRGKCNLSPYAMPFGYKAEVIDGMRRMVIDKEKEPIVRDAIDHYRKYQVKQGTTRYINEKYNLQLSHSFMQRLTSCEFYYGKYRENENYCEPYITKEEFLELQRISKSKMKSYTKDEKFFLFTGILRCPECGRRLESQSQVQPSGWRYYYYRCYAPYRTGACNFRGNINERYIESYLLEHIEDELAKYENSAATSMEKENKIVDFEKYKKEMDRLTNAYIKGRIDESYYDDEYARLKAIIDEFTTKEPDQSKKDIDSVKKLFGKNWKSAYLLLDRQNRKAFWQSIIESIEFNEDKTVKNVYFL